VKNDVEGCRVFDQSRCVANAVTCVDLTQPGLQHGDIDPTEHEEDVHPFHNPVFQNCAIPNADFGLLIIPHEVLSVEPASLVDVLLLIREDLTEDCALIFNLRLVVGVVLLLQQLQVLLGRLMEILDYIGLNFVEDFQHASEDLLRLANQRYHANCQCQEDGELSHAKPNGEL
jgi:hypothetical protein